MKKILSKKSCFVQNDHWIYDLWTSEEREFQEPNLHVLPGKKKHKTNHFTDVSVYPIKIPVGFPTIAMLVHQETKPLKSPSPWSPIPVTINLEDVMGWSILHK